MIHPTAVVDPEAVLGRETEVGPHAVIEAGCVLGEKVVLGAQVVLRRGTILGAGTVVHAGAVLGGEPQDLSFDPSLDSGVIVGAESIIREGVTVNRSTRPGHHTRLGQKVFLMANSHVGHDCEVGDEVILANNVLLAGHVRVGAQTFFGGGAGIHQFVRIGTGVMVGGLAAITRDLPPYCLVGERDRMVGLNLVGLRRRGIPREQIAILKGLLLEYGRDGRAFAAEAEARLAAESWEANHPGAIFLNFFCESRRGICPFNVSRSKREEEA